MQSYASFGLSTINNSHLYDMYQIAYLRNRLKNLTISDQVSMVTSMLVADVGEEIVGDNYRHVRVSEVIFKTLSPKNVYH